MTEAEFRGRVVPIHESLANVRQVSFLDSDSHRKAAGRDRKIHAVKKGLSVTTEF